MWDYETGKVIVFNSTLNSYPGVTVSATLYNIPDLSQKYSDQKTIDVPADRPAEALTIPAIDGLSKTYFIRLQLRDGAGEVLNENLYWYSTQPDVFDFSKSDWYITPVTNYANLTGLNELVRNADVKVSAAMTSGAGQDNITVRLVNENTTNIAFFVRAEVVAGKDGAEVAPVVYSDNYVTLWPGETNVIRARYPARALDGASPTVKVKGYNTPEFSAKPAN